MSLHNAGRLTGVPDLLAYLALLKSQHWIQSAMSSHRHTPKSAVTAMVLALFMLLNDVVVVGEEADHSVHDSTLADIQHGAFHDAGTHPPLSDNVDCESHHGCHSHSPMNLPVVGFAHYPSGAQKDWESHYRTRLISNHNRPPVPPPDQQPLV